MANSLALSLIEAGLIANAGRFSDVNKTSIITDEKNTSDNNVVLFLPHKWAAGWQKKINNVNGVRDVLDRLPAYTKS